MNFIHMFYALCDLSERSLLLDGPDKKIGDFLAWDAELVGHRFRVIYELLGHYRGELKSAGYNFDDFPRPPGIFGGHADREAELKGRFVILSFPHDDRVVHDIEKRFPKSLRSYRPKLRDWRLTVTSENLDEALDFLIRHRFDFGSDLLRRARAALDQSQALSERSRAVTSSFPLPPILRDPYPFQAAGIEYAVRARRCIIADEPGLGKTLQAIVSVAALKATPCLVIAPANVKLKWGREIRDTLPGVKVQLLKAVKEDLADAITEGPVRPGMDFYVINYDYILRTVKVPKKEKLKKAHFVIALQLLALGIESLVCDEAHYLKNNKTKRALAAGHLARKLEVILHLTGTPIESRPEEAVNLLKILRRLDEFGGYWPYVHRYCDAKRTPFGWDTSGASHTVELNEKLRRVGYVRRTKDEVGLELPERTRSFVPLEMSNPASYFKLEEQLLDWISQESAVSGGHLTRISALRREVAERKLKAAKEWISDFLESGEKLVVFAHHKSIVQDLAREFNASRVDGSRTPIQKQEAVDAFQSDPKINLIVCNLEAGGVAITLTAASNVAFLEFPWTPGELRQCEDRVHRIGQVNPVTSWLLYAPDTIDESSLSVIEGKRATVDEVTDGEERTEQADTALKELVSEFLAKHERPPLS